MLFQPVSEQVVAKALKEAVDKYQAVQKLSICNLKRMYYGALKEFVDDYITKVFADKDEQGKLKALTNTSVNIVQYVVEETTTIYRYGATRRWMFDQPKKGEDGKSIDFDEAATKAYADILDEADADEALEMASLWTALTHDCILRYQYGRRGHTVYTMTRDVCDVITDPDDPRYAVGLIYYVTNIDTPVFLGDVKKATDVRWYYIDAEKKMQFEVDGTVIPGTTEPNPYAELNASRKVRKTKIFAPFVDFHDRYREDTFWAEHIDESLASAQNNLCYWLTYVNYLLKFTVKQPYLIGMLGDVPDQKMSTDRVFLAQTTGGGTAQAGVFDFSIQLGDAIDTLQKWLSMFAIARRMPPNAFQLYATKEPGVSIKVNRSALKEYRAKGIKHFISREASLAEIIQYAANKTWKGLTIPDSQHIDNALDPRKLLIEFGEPEDDADPKEDREAWDWLFEHDLAALEDYLVAKQGLTAEQARNRIETIRTDNLRIAADRTKARDFGTFDDRPTEDEDSDTTNQQQEQ